MSRRTHDAIDPELRPTLARLMARPVPELCEVPDCFDDEELGQGAAGEVVHTRRCTAHRPAEQRKLF